MKRNEPVCRGLPSKSRNHLVWSQAIRRCALQFQCLTEFPLAVLRCQQARMALLRPAREAALAAALS